ncbi:MAG TPA: ParB/RepB/Spo0J family partition protein [Candidatus Binatia bacterium]|jgi:ParB family chromosome partitioning protein
MMRKPLGRGLNALIPGATKPVIPPLSTAPETSEVEQRVAVDRIQPNPRQPRTEFDEAALQELAASIRTQGIIQPLLVRPSPANDGDYELVAGERRLRAARLAGVREVPIVVRELSDRESLELALVENIQRDDLSPLEEAAAYQRLIDDFGHTQEDIATRVGKSRPAIANAIRLLKLPESIRRELSRGRLTAGHARVLLSLDSADAQLRAARQILARQLSVRDTERLASSRNKKSAAANASGRDPHRAALERELAASLGTRVRIVPGRRGGRIEIEYYSNEELQGLAERLSKRSRNFDNP